MPWCWPPRPSSSPGAGDPTPPPAGAATPPTSSASTSPTPTTSSATSTTPTATPSTEATDPNIPPAAKAQTSDGAVAFTGYFAAQANASYQTLNPELLTPLVISECKTCTAMIKQINEYITRQQKYGSPGMSVGPMVRSGQ